MRPLRLSILGAAIFVVAASYSHQARAQFAPGQPLSANALNAALANPTIIGGTINGAPIGATVASTGRFTTLSATTFVLTGTAFGTNLVPGPDTGRFGLDGLRFINNVTNDNSYLTLMPNGTGTESAFRLYNKSDPTGINTGSITFRVNGAGAFIEPAAFGTGTIPTLLSVSMPVAATYFQATGVVSAVGTMSFESNFLVLQGGTAGFQVRDSGDANTNLQVSDAGAATFRTSVITPLVQSSGTADLTAQVGVAYGWTFSVSPNTSFFPFSSDNVSLLGRPTNRWLTTFVSNVDSGVAGSLLLRTNNGATQTKIVNAGDGTNYANIQGGATTFSPVLFSNGADTNVGLILTTKGSGQIDFTTGGTFSGDINSGRTRQFLVDHTASAINYIKATGGGAGNSPFFQALGETNTGMRIIASGTGNIVFEAPGGTTQFTIIGTASANRNITVTGSNNGNPTINVTGGSLAITPAVTIGGTLAAQYNANNFVVIGTPPTMGACGTSPSVVGDDTAMLITVGTGGTATSCAVTFALTYTTNPPVCIAQNNTDRVAYNMVTTTSTLTITATAAFTASSKFHVHCIGWL